MNDGSEQKTTEQAPAPTEAPAEPSPKAEVPKEKTFLKLLKQFANRYFIEAFSGMANGLFCTLIAGTIVCQIARLFGGGTSEVEFLNLCYRFLNGIGTFAKVMMGAGIGVGIAYALKSSKMAMACSVAVGIFAANATTFLSYIVGETALSASVLIGTGNPITCYLAVVIACELGTLVTGKTKLDILIVPLVSLLSGGLVAAALGSPVEWLPSETASMRRPSCSPSSWASSSRRQWGFSSPFPPRARRSGSRSASTASPRARASWDAVRT